MTRQPCYPPPIVLGNPVSKIPGWGLFVAMALIWLTYTVIVLGAATRVWDAGMSCPDWPHCYGLWWPWPEARVIALNGAGYVVEGFHYAPYQVFLEWFHRLCAASVGVLMVTLALLLWRRRSLRLPFTATFTLLVIQVKLGAVTVWLGNIHWSVALHLGNAMLMLASIMWLRRLLASADIPAAATPQDRQAWLVLGGFAILVWITMIVGGFVSSAHAGGLCGGLLDCAGAWWPQEPLQKMHMLHRILAFLVLGWSIAVMIIVKRRAPHLRPSAVMVHGMVWGQAALGIATLYSFSLYPDYYRPLSLIHLAWGTAVFMAAVGLLLRLEYSDAGHWHG